MGRPQEARCALDLDYVDGFINHHARGYRLNAHSDAKRSLIPGETDHPFRSPSIADSDAF
jgi:hypothetical protein